MLPDMSDALAEWMKPYIVKTVTRATLDFEPVDVVKARTIQAVIQPAQRGKLNPDQIDWSKRYLQVHTDAVLNNGEFLEFNSEDYKIIDDGDYQLYGYTDAVAEQTKMDPLVITT